MEPTALGRRLVAGMATGAAVLAMMAGAPTAEAAHRVTCFGEPATIVGTDGRDFLYGPRATT